jgi:hypothetical protein
MAHDRIVNMKAVLLGGDFGGLLPRISVAANLPQEARQEHVQRQFRVAGKGFPNRHRADAAQLIHDFLRVVGRGGHRRRCPWRCG